MSKNNPKKAARQRRRSRQRQLVEAGRQAEDLVATYRQQAVEAVERAGRLEAEAAKARQESGEATALLAETNKAMDANATILEGLRAELDLAAQQVKVSESERDAMAADLAKARKELEIARAADIDTKSLRSRLQRKSEEIDGLKARLRDAVASLRRATSVHGFDHTEEGEVRVDGREEGAGGPECDRCARRPPWQSVGVAMPEYCDTCYEHSGRIVLLDRLYEAVLDMTGIPRSQLDMLLTSPDLVTITDTLSQQVLVGKFLGLTSGRG